MTIKEGMSTDMQEFLEKRKKDFTRWVECPSHFEKEPLEPAALARETKFFKAGTAVEGIFGDMGHTAWEEYQKTMSAPIYKTVMSGNLYPKRREVTDKTMSQ